MRLLVLILALLFASPILAADFVVDSMEDTNDDDPGDGSCDDGTGACTLRAAIQEANALGGADTVTLGAGVHPLQRKRDSGGPDEASGDLDVTSDITITGQGQKSRCRDGEGCTAIDGKKGKDRVFDVHVGGVLRLETLSVLNGKAPKDDFNPTQGFVEVSGGCIRVDGELETDEVVIERCKSPDDGGCIGMTDGSTATLVDTHLDRCKTKDGGGGIEVDSSTLDATRVTISNSKAGDEGGGVETTAGSVSLANVTLSKNKAKQGGGLSAESDADVSVNNTTFFDNKAKLGASIFADMFFQFTPIEVSNSLVRTGGKELNCDAPISSLGGNLDNGTTCGFECNDCDPDISKDLLDNGGEVPTHAIGSFSQGINFGNDMTCEPTDARGFDRNGTCDSGAYEFDAPLP